MTTITTTNNNQGLVASRLGTIAWKRSMAIALVFGIWGSVAASKGLETTAEAFGYTLGYGTAVLVTGAGATAVMAKEQDV